MSTARCVKPSMCSSSLPTQYIPSSVNTIKWYDQWYPISSTVTLQTSVPNQLKLMGIDLVAWECEDGWSVARDRCPHRNAPLSYGRIENNGTLSCSYHGWQFSQKGELVRNPTSKTQMKGCLRMYPSRVCPNGLLWVWAGDAALVKEMLPIDHLPHPSHRITDWMVNRVPITWTSLVENLFDDAHALHSHHGFPGMDRSSSRPSEKITSGHGTYGDDFFAWMNVSGNVSNSVEWTNSYKFRSPHRSSIGFGPFLKIEAFVVPVTSDETLLVSSAFWTAPSVFKDFIVRSVRENRVATAVMHRLGTEVVCQDVILAEADGLRYLNGESKVKYTRSDSGVAHVRSWLQTVGGPPFSSSILPFDLRSWKHRNTLNVWDMHVQHCPACKQTHDDAETLGKVFLGLSIVTAASHLTLAAALFFVMSEGFRAFERWFRVHEVKFRK